MKIIKQQATLLEHSRNDPYGFIEDVARVCYKSEAKKTSESALKMVQNLIKAKHYAVLEHEYVYFKIDSMVYEMLKADISVGNLKYINIDPPYMSASFRALLELYENIKDETDFDMEVAGEIFYQLHQRYPHIFPSVSKPGVRFNVHLISRDEFIKEYGEKSDEPSPFIPHTIKFTTNRGISHELCRHRPLAISMESQRYVAYDQDKHGSQIEIINPLIDPSDIENYNAWHYAMIMAETQYMNLRKNGIKPEIARGVLPNDCKTEIVITATETEWQHIINLRYHGTTGAPHPQMKELMGLALPILNKESGGRIQ